MRIGPGSVVVLAPGVEVAVSGAFEINGSLSAPVLFAPSVNGRPWGGIRLTTTAGSRLAGQGVLFTGSGADATWFNTHAGYSTHRREQACVLVDTGAQAFLTNCLPLQRVPGHLGLRMELLDLSHRSDEHPQQLAHGGQ